MVRAFVELRKIDGVQETNVGVQEEIRAKPKHPSNTSLLFLSIHSTFHVN